MGPHGDHMGPHWGPKGPRKPKTLIFLRFFNGWSQKHRFSLGFLKVEALSGGSQSQNGEDVSSGIRGQEFAAGSTGSGQNGVRSCGSDPAFHAQGSQDDVSSQANSLKLHWPESWPDHSRMGAFCDTFCDCQKQNASCAFMQSWFWRHLRSELLLPGWLWYQPTHTHAHVRCLIMETLFCKAKSQKRLIATK